jgi:phosphoribosylformylglycinamidine synthase
MSDVSDLHFGVVTFPGSNCEQDAVHALRHLGLTASYIWHQDTSLNGIDAVILPGGFSYGDYLRCGAVARFSPVMNEVVRYAQAGRPVIGICNGFQVLTEAHLLPGALIRNRGLKFLCQSVHLRAEKSVCKWLDLAPGTVLEIPIAHNEGNYICDPATLAALQDNGQIVLRYCEPDGSRAAKELPINSLPPSSQPICPESAQPLGAITASSDLACPYTLGAYRQQSERQAINRQLPGGSAPNGALDDIAGICNERGNVFGLMPHPERVTDGVNGSVAGSVFFTTIARYAWEVAAR